MISLKFIQNKANHFHFLDCLKTWLCSICRNWRIYELQTNYQNLRIYGLAHLRNLQICYSE
jgi:hypothetical protein